MQSTTIGIDLAKSVFQLSLADEHGRIQERLRLTRSQFQRFLGRHDHAHLVMEACGTAHHWGRVTATYGHQVTLLHPGYVRPYVRRNKTDAADADALIRAVRDPELKPVPVKSIDQQALQSVHRIRQQLLDTRKQRINIARSLFAEFGVPLPRGTKDVVIRLRSHQDELPAVLVQVLEPMLDEINHLKARIDDIDRSLKQYAGAHPVIGQLTTVPGVGIITATALFASVPDIHQFKRARQFASWLGVLCPNCASAASTVA